MEAIKNKIISDLFKNPAFVNRLKSIARNDYEDLCSDVIEVLLKKDAQYIIDRYKNKALYATAVKIARNLNKPLLLTRKKYINNIQHNNKGEQIEVIENLVSQQQEDDLFNYRIEVFNESFKELPFFSRFILDELLLSGGNAKRVAEDNSFDYSGVLKAVNIAKRQLQQIIQSKTEDFESSNEPRVKNKSVRQRNSLDILNQIEILN